VAFTDQVAGSRASSSARNIVLVGCSEDMVVCYAKFLRAITRIPSFVGLITWLKHPYPRDVREPAMYDHIRIHAQLQETGGGQPQEHLAVCA